MFEEKISFAGQILTWIDIINLKFLKTMFYKY